MRVTKCILWENIIDGFRLGIVVRKPAFHYENMSMQHTAIFHGCKNDKFQLICFYYFHIFAQNKDCGYTLEPPHLSGSNEYPQSMF